MKRQKQIKSKVEEKTFKYYLKKINSFDYSIIAGIIFILLLFAAIRGWYPMFTHEDWNSGYQKVNLNTTNTINDLSGWKTYINDDYGFEFKYPEGVEIEEGDNGVTIWNKKSIQKAQEYGTWIPAEFSIKKFSNEKITVTPEWLAQWDSNFTLQSFTETIGGKEAFVALPTELGARTYFIPTNNGTLAISAWGYENGKYYKSVIDTLRFKETDVNYVDFKDDILGVQFSYPTFWGVIKGSLTGTERDPNSTYGGYAYNFSFDDEFGGSALDSGSITSGGRSVDFSAGRGAYIADFHGFGDKSTEEVCGMFSATECEVITDSIISMLVAPKYENICPPAPGQDSFSKIVAINLPDNPKINGLVFEYTFLSKELKQELYYDILGNELEKCYETSSETQEIFDDKINQIVEQIKSEKVDDNTLKNIRGFDTFVNSIELY